MSQSRIVHATFSFFLFAAALFLLLPNYFYATSFGGLDGSWQLALHLAWEKGFHFGSEFLFTYGPLGFLSSRYAFESSYWEMLLNDLFLYTSIFYFGFQLWIRAKNIPAGIAAIFVAIGMPEAMQGLELSISYLVLTMCFTFQFLDTRNKVFIFLAALTSTLAFYIKLNSGLVCGVLLAGSFLYLALSKEVPWKTFFISVMALLGCIGIGSLILPVDLFSYLRGGIEIAAGYNEAMVIVPEQYNQILVMAVVLCVSYLLFGVAKLPSLLLSPESLCKFMWVVACTFIVFKQAFVRADGHVLIFPIWIAVIAAIGALYLKNSELRGMKVIFGIALLFSFALSNQRLTFDLFQRRIASFSAYLDQVFMSTEEARALYLSPQLNPLPEEIVKAVGSSTVDIFPWDVWDVYASKLDYRPRPVMQSYSAYTPYLDSLNSSTFAGTRDPSFVIFRSLAVDNRYPWFDESLTKQTIARNFDVIDQSGDWVLLKRRAVELARTREPIGEERRAFGERINFPATSDLVYGRFAISYSLWGTIAKIFFQVPPPKITFRFEDGSEETFRAVVPIIKSEVLLSHFVKTSDDAKLFFQREISKLKKVKDIRITASSAWAFKPRFTVNYSKVGIASNER